MLQFESGPFAYVAIRNHLGLPPSSEQTEEKMAQLVKTWVFHPQKKLKKAKKLFDDKVDAAKAVPEYQKPLKRMRVVIFLASVSALSLLDLVICRRFRYLRGHLSHWPTLLVWRWLVYSGYGPWISYSHCQLLWKVYCWGLLHNTSPAHLEVHWQGPYSHEA